MLSLGELLERRELYEHVLVSLKRVLLGLFLALLVGVPLGLLVGASRNLEAATTPAFQFLRMISPLSWMPIAVMLMGVGDQPIYFLLAFAALWPILLNTAAGVRQLDPRWLQLSRSLAATPWETLRRVILPGILGHVLTGVRLAIGILWIVLVPCEMLGVSAGLGYYILDTRDRLAYSEADGDGAADRPARLPARRGGARTLPALGARGARVGRGTGALADSAGALFALRGNGALG